MGRPKGVHPLVKLSRYNVWNNSLKVSTNVVLNACVKTAARSLASPRQTVYIPAVQAIKANSGFSVWPENSLLS